MPKSSNVEAECKLTINTAYCIDTYPELSGEAMITVIVIRNTMGFAITSYA